MEALKLRKPMAGATVTMTVEQTAGFKGRLRVGMALLRLAVWIMGGATEVKASKFQDIEPPRER